MKDKLQLSEQKKGNLQVEVWTKQESKVQTFYIRLLNHRIIINPQSISSRDFTQYV